MIQPQNQERSDDPDFKFDGSDPFPTNWSPEQWRSLLSERLVDLQSRAPQLCAVMQSEVPEVWSKFEMVLERLTQIAPMFETAPLDPEQFLGDGWRNLLTIRSFVVNLKMTREYGADPEWRLTDEARYGFSSPDQMWQTLKPFAEAVEIFTNFIEDRPFAAKLRDFYPDYE